MLDFGLKAEVVSAISEVLSRYPEVEKALIYGSRVKGNYRNGSDIDLTLVGDININRLGAVSIELDDLLLPYTFDLSIYQHIANKDLIDHIERIGVDFYTKSRA